MKVDRLAVLQEICDVCLQNRKEINKKIQNNLERVSEIDAFLQSVREEMESDFKVFSPRSAETIYKEKIEENNKEKEIIENDNQNHYRELSKVDRQIEKLELLMKDLNGETIEGEDIVTSTDTRPVVTPTQTMENVDYFSMKVLDLQEKERQRIARDLHDSSVQNLTHLIHSIELSSMFIEQDPIRAKLELETCMKTLKTAIDEIRETIFDLRPMSFDDLGFKNCLEEFISTIKSQYSDCDVTYSICEISIENIEKSNVKNKSLILMTLFRIVQEALTNSLKHAQADKVNIEVSQREEKCFINVTDNGSGFAIDNFTEQKDKHFGLSIMKERVKLLSGDISINTELGVGTEIKIEIPLL